MNDTSGPIAVRKSEHAIARVETDIASLRRKARHTRFMVLAILPFAVAHVFAAAVIFGDGITVDHLFNGGGWIQTLMLATCVALILGLGWAARWLMRSALDFDRQATRAMHKLASSPEAPLEPLNLSKLAASVSAKGIRHRLLWTRLRRLLNATMALGALVMIAFGGVFLVVSVPMLVSPDSIVGSHLVLFVIGVLGVVGGVACCAILLKSGQRLIEVQESLVEVGVHVANAKAQPGSLLLASPVSQGGQLSMGTQGGALTQAHLDEESGQ